MDCITLYQPWASWVAEGFKPIETRDHDKFKRLKGKRIGIHAGIRYDHEAMITARNYLNSDLIETRNAVLRDYTFGVIVCTAHVIDARMLNDNDSAAARINCSSGLKFGLILTEIEKLPVPVPYRGRQGIFTVDDTLIYAYKKY